MLSCPVKSRAVPRLRAICVDETATDPLSLKCKSGHLRLREGLSLLSLTSPGVGLLDIGSHIGLISLVFAANGRAVNSIEANPTNAGLLRESARLNGFDNLMVHGMAVSDKTGTLEFAPHGPFGYVAGDHTPHDHPAIKVDSIRLDDWAGASAVPTSVLIKMDIEGHELHALRGMQEFLGVRKFPPLFVESNAHCLHWVDQTPQSLSASLEAMGYELFVAKRNKWFPWRNQFELRPWDSSMPQAVTVENLLCVRRNDDRVVLPAIGPRRTSAEFVSELARAAASRHAADQQNCARVLSRMTPEERTALQVGKLVAKLKKSKDEEVVAALKGP